MMTKLWNLSIKLYVISTWWCCSWMSCQLQLLLSAKQCWRLAAKLATSTQRIRSEEISVLGWKSVASICLKCRFSFCFIVCYKLLVYWTHSSKHNWFNCLRLLSFTTFIGIPSLHVLIKHLLYVQHYVYDVVYMTQSVTLDVHDQIENQCLAKTCLYDTVMTISIAIQWI